MDGVKGGDIVAGTKTLFHSRCIQALPELVLISRPGSHNDDGNIGLLGCFNGRGESGLVVAPALTSLSIVDLSVRSDCRLDASKRSDATILAFVNNIVSVLRQESMSDISYQERGMKCGLTFMNPSAIGPMTAMLPDFFRGRMALWFSKSTIDSLSRSRASFLASALLIRLFHSLFGAAGYGFSKRPISNLTRSSRDTAVSTVLISSLPDLTSSGISWKLLFKY